MYHFDNSNSPFLIVIDVFFRLLAKFWAAEVFKKSLSCSFWRNPFLLVSTIRQNLILPTWDQQKSSEMWYPEAPGENIKGWKQNPSWKVFCLLFKHLFEIRSQGCQQWTVPRQLLQPTKTRLDGRLKSAKEKNRENRLRLKGRNYFEDILGF